MWKKYIGSLRDLEYGSASVERHTAAIRNFHKFMAVEQICEGHRQLKIYLLQQIPKGFPMLSHRERQRNFLMTIPSHSLGIRDRQ